MAKKLTKADLEKRMKELIAEVDELTLWKEKAEDSAKRMVDSRKKLKQELDAERNNTRQFIKLMPRVLLRLNFFKWTFFFSVKRR